jgi:precorrin-8X/cobalt-precorrin-8 methylmutase
MTTQFNYRRDAAEIYAQSFATIRAEADLAQFSAAQERVAVRVIHACGMVEIARDLQFSADFTTAAREALLAGKPVFCDSKMVAHGITRSRLPANNDVICTLDEPGVSARASALCTTRSAAALDIWGRRLGGALVAIGNAPTALFRLLDLLEAGVPSPAAVIGMPVGFVGAAESKDALATYGGVPYLIVRGRKGGSAMAAATVNALASEVE